MRRVTLRRRTAPGIRSGQVRCEATTEEAMRSPLLPAFGLTVLAACAGRAPTPDGASRSSPGLAEQVVAAADRTERDRSMDSHRKPAPMLTFFGLAPGMRVAELGAGGGYSTELFARSVGPSGVVYAQDTPNWDGPGLQKAWEMRLGRPALQNTKPVMRQWDDPLPPEGRTSTQSTRSLSITTRSLKREIPAR